MASTTPSAGGSPSLGMAPNVTATLCYLPLCCAGLVLSIVAAVAEKENRFVRFHAFQSLLVHGTLVVVVVALQIFRILLGLISSLLSLLFMLVFGLLGLAILGAMILLMVKAYGNEEFLLPVVGEMAKKWA